VKIDSNLLIEWFQKNKRPLPWRNKPTVYQIWISEVMLQQTQAATVIPYYEKWIKRYPSIFSLAEASELEVMKSWEGLGYYCRARNLHLAAKHIVKKYNGIIPQGYEELKTIKGFGPYTIGAVLGFGYHQKIPAIDGNVTRVITRYFAIESPVEGSKTKSQIYQLVYDHLPEEKAWVFSEALIELGALVCKKNPQCRQCPLRRSCKAHKLRRQKDFPQKKKAASIKTIYRGVFLFKYKSKYLIHRVEQQKVMSGLYEFMYIDVKDPDSIDGELKHILSQKKVSSTIRPLKQQLHTFTKYKAILFPYLIEISSPIGFEKYEWVDEKKFKKLPFSSGHRKIIGQVNGTS